MLLKCFLKLLKNLGRVVERVQSGENIRSQLLTYWLEILNVSRLHFNIFK